jgi:hypothetical protein
MEVMLQREQSRQLTGRVEIDDAYLGEQIQGGKAGRVRARLITSRFVLKRTRPAVCP